MEEVWKPIPDFPNYHASNLGRIKSDLSNKVLKPGLNEHGYEIVVLRKDKRSHTKKVHRLVALAHLENPLNLPVVDHINKPVTNNRIDNLRWTTSSINNQRKLYDRPNRHSNYYGVHFDKRLVWNRFYAYIRVTKGKSQNLGYFATEEEAARAYDAKARELYGEHARLNFP
jgi:hypothetical protein